MTQLSIESYQRAQDSDRARKIARDWDERLRRIPIVNATGRGTYNVVDGQHTLAAERILGHTGAWCEVKDVGDDIAAEADAFVKLNTSQKRITPLERYKGNVIAELDPEFTLHELLENQGFSLGESSSANVVACVSGVVAQARSHGPDIAAAGIFIAAQAFGRQASSYQNSVPVAIALVLGRNNNINVGELVAVLSDTSRGQIIDAAEKLRNMGVTTNSAEHYRIARVICNLYNKKHRGSRRINVGT